MLTHPHIQAVDNATELRRLRIKRKQLERESEINAAYMEAIDRKRACEQVAECDRAIAALEKVG